jgi:hypothetical protein
MRRCRCRRTLDQEEPAQFDALWSQNQDVEPLDALLGAQSFQVSAIGGVAGAVISRPRVGSPQAIQNPASDLVLLRIVLSTLPVQPFNAANRVAGNRKTATKRASVLDARRSQKGDPRPIVGLYCQEIRRFMSPLSGYPLD